MNASSTGVAIWKGLGPVLRAVPMLRSGPAAMWPAEMLMLVSEWCPDSISQELL